MFDLAWSAQENVMPIYGTTALDVEFYAQGGQTARHAQGGLNSQSSKIFHAM